MNHSQDDHRGDPLREALHERAEALHEAPVTLDDVRDRAGGIRRRRRIAAAVGALAVVAVLAPVGILALGGDDDAGTPTASDGAGPVAPRPVGRVDFTGADLGRGADTSLPYLTDDGVVVDGEAAAEPRSLQANDAAELDGALAVGGTNDRGGMSVYLRPEDETIWVGTNAPVADPVTSSERRGRVAWVFGDAANQEVSLAEPDSVGYLESAPDATLPIEDGDATAWRPVGMGPEWIVLEDVAGSESSVVLAAPGEGAREVPGLLRASGVDQVSGRISGVASRSDDGSCSAIVDPDGAVAWRTCDYTLLGFSPNGRWVLATGPYRSGFGDTTTAVLDARTGELQAEWRAANPDESATWISRRWEDDESFVAVLVVGNEVSLVRFDIDGSAEYAADPVTVEDPAIDMPYVLPED